MTTDRIGTLRRFNRLVTERIGALHDDYLARSRPLGASRVLWEIGPNGTDVRRLRTGLSLDSGYLSRLLGSLQAEGLIRVGRDEKDGRVRSVRLTTQGLSERETLDRLSNELAESLLEPLDEGERRRLVEAAATVERLLIAGMVVIVTDDPTSEDARFCIEEYFRELDSRFETGFDPAQSISADDEELVEPAGLLLLARLRDRPVGCGALKLHVGHPGEIKRMWVSPDSRGLGLGRRILTALEDEARRRGVDALRLETNQSLDEAIALYRSAGYWVVPAFNDEPFAHHWFEKTLG